MAVLRFAAMAGRSFDMTLLLMLLFPLSALAGGSVTVSIKDIGAITGAESLNLQGAAVVALLNTEYMIQQ